MSLSNHLHRVSVVGGLALALAVAWSAPTAHANVYATNVRLEGGTTNVSLPDGGTLSISYTLNEAASQGVTVNILNGASIVRSITAEGGQPGTFAGTNTLVWDGKGNNGASAPGGTYAVSVTAASLGYATWTQVTDDTNPGNHVWEGYGIAVDRNASSPYYGRVFVGNAASGPDPANNPADRIGILKLNADGSPAEEGIYTDGGYNWVGGTVSPWKIEVSDDDYVYINDWQLAGEIYRWDPTLSTNSLLQVLGTSNYPYPENNLSGPAIFGSGTNTFVWMADYNGSQSLGLIRYHLTAEGTCAANDTGTQMVALGSSLTQAPYDVALDKNGNVYTILSRATPQDPDPRVLRFSASGAPDRAADWAIGAGDDTMGKAYGIAVDPTGTYVAVAFKGVGDVSTNGCTQIFYATNGALVTNLDLGVSISGSANHWDTDCAWDAVGNVYYIDNSQLQDLTGNYFAVWRAFSPPGPNQATTVALQTVQVGGAPPGQGVQILNVDVQGGTATILFQGNPGDSPSSFSVQTAASVLGPYATVEATIRVGTTPGQFMASLPANAGASFYRILGGSAPPPPTGFRISSISVASGTVTLLFSGAAGDPPTAFTVFSAGTPAGPYAAATGADVKATTNPGEFRATLPATGSARFYRIGK